VVFLRRPLALTVAIVALAACAATPAARDRPAGAHTVAEDVVYATGRTLDVIMPARMPADRVPIVVMLHGCCGDRSDLAKLGEAIAAEKIAVLNVSWGGLGVDGSYERSFVEAGCAIRWAKAEGDTYGADSRRVALLGWSDGALAGAVVAQAGDALSADGCAAPGESALPDAFVGVNGFYGWTLPVDASYVTDRAVRFFGGTPVERPQAWTDATPYAWLGAQSSMTNVLLVGATSPLLPDAERFDAALRRAGQTSRLLVLQPAGDQSLISPRTEEGRVVAREAADAARGAG
jgi:acetyl esterase/lipase